MRFVTTLAAGALALAIPAVPAIARAQPPYDDEANTWEAPPPEQTFTLVRVSPPVYGVVYLYEGRRLVGRFDRPGAMWLPTGRSYRVVALRGEQPIWRGWTETTGAPVNLYWAPPRPRRPSTVPYAPPPSYAVPPPSYAPPPRPAPGYAPYGAYAPIVTEADLLTLLRALDSTDDEAQKLTLVESAAARYAFARGDADRILMRFSSDVYRGLAEGSLAPRIVDRYEPPPAPRPAAPPVEEGRSRTPW